MHVSALTKTLSPHQLSVIPGKSPRPNRPNSLTIETVPDTPNTDATTTPAAAPGTSSQPANGEHESRLRHPRRHVQQYLRHLERIVRHEIKRELKEAEGLDPETSSQIKELGNEFRHQLRDTFLEAGRGNEFDPAAILTGLSEAVVDLTNGLQALRGDPQVAETPPPAEPGDDLQTAPVVTPNEPAVMPYAPVEDPRQPSESILSLQA